MATTTLTGTYAAIPTAHLSPSVKNPRKGLTDIAELAASIREVGVLEPLIVTPSGDHDGYTVIIGHRRLAAALKIGLPELPCIIREDLTAPGVDVVGMLVENLQRVDLNVIEQAAGYAQLELLGFKPAEIAKRTGRSTTEVAQKAKLVDLPDKSRVRLLEGQIPIEHAIEIAEHADDPERVAYLEKHAGTASFTWHAKDWPNEVKRRERAAAEKKQIEQARKAARAAEAAAKKAGTAVTPATKPKKTAAQLRQERMEQRKDAIEEAADTAATVRRAWLQEQVTLAAKKKLTIPEPLLGFLRIGAEHAILGWSESIESLREWLGIKRPDVRDVPQVVAGLNAAQLLLLVVFSQEDLRFADELLEFWNWDGKYRPGPVAYRQLVDLLNYPISDPEIGLIEQATTA